jgi:type I restriction enzyme S subunit
MIIEKTLGTVAQYINGRAFKPAEWENVGLPIIRIQNLNDETAKYNYSSSNFEEKFRVKNGDLLFSWSASLGAHIWKGNDAWLNQHIFRVIPNQGIDKMYLYYFLCYVVRELLQKTHGSGMVHITKKPFMETKIFVPPIPEQERIVARIEELFSELDKAIETLNTTKQQLAVYRQAVLKEAFEGDFPKVPLRDISNAISGYAFKSKRYSADGKYVVIKIGNVKERYFDFSKDFTHTDEIEGNILGKYLLKRGDCLITLTGSRGKRDYGFVAMVEDQDNFLLNQRVAALRFNPNKSIPEFYQYYLASPEYRSEFFRYETGNVGQGNVGIKALQEPLVVCPTVDMQKRIVEKIESRLSVCDSIEQTVDTALQQAEAMRQSILKQAFEGRL